MTDPTLPDGLAVFDQAPGAFVLADAEMVLLRANTALADLIGQDPAELAGRDGYDFMLPGERDAARARVAELLANGRPYSVDQCFRHPAGREVWLRLHVGLVRAEDGTAFVMAQVEDTTDRRRTEARLQRLAERDHLTGLLNRRRVEEELEAALAGARRHGRVAALILVDLDHFKAVNDREGHEAGDRVLSFVAATLATRVREEDAVGRLGGDEFAVLLRDASLEAAEAVAAELVALVADAGYTRQRGVTLSAGVAALTRETRSAQDALHAADLAMYAAKDAGRDRVAVHGPSAGPAPAGDHRTVTLAPRVPDGAPGRGLLPGGLQSVADAPTVEHALQAVRELLGTDVAYVTRHDEHDARIVAADGDLTPLGLALGDRVPLGETAGAAVLERQAPDALPALAVLPGSRTARVGASAAVPIRRSDESLYGMLCAMRPARTEELGARDLRVLTILARMIGGELERDASLRAELELRVQAAGADALLTAIDARDRYTGSHSREVVELAAAVGFELGLADHEQHAVAQVALLHDIGKLALSDAILSKPGPLSHDEIVQMRRHPEDGERIVAAIPELSHLAPAIRAEHERWDGMGYPDGLAGEDIPVASRIVFVCDAWDAMTSDRPYRRRMPRDEALAELAAGAGTQFCGHCVQALFTVLSRG